MATTRGKVRKATALLGAMIEDIAPLGREITPAYTATLSEFHRLLGSRRADGGYADDCDVLVGGFWIAANTEREVGEP